MHTPTCAHISQAVKDIYGRLAQTAAEIDQGIPQLLLSLVGTGNVFSSEVTAANSSQLDENDLDQSKLIQWAETTHWSLRTVGCHIWRI